jgi:hypothetical protein
MKDDNDHITRPSKNIRRICICEPSQLNKLSIGLLVCHVAKSDDSHKIVAIILPTVPRKMVAKIFNCFDMLLYALAANCNA